MMRSYEMLARYVMPRCQGLIKPIEASAARVTANKAELMEKAGGAILKAIRDYNAVHPRQK
jgi:NAD(P)H-hydrate repair Nnr-like enzyme with NAD(P)H-hydrate epimerase domain